MRALLLDLLYIPLALAYLPFLLYQMIVLKKNRRGWGQRFGLVRPRVSIRPCVWIHAVSLGEVNATKSLVTQIEQRLPEYDIVISATTDTGYAAAVKQYQPGVVFRYPLDFSCVVRRVLNRIRPDAIVLMELEVWPNFVGVAARRGVPVIVANGRITEERSMRRFRLPVVRGLARRMFGKITFAGVQNETYAARFAEIGVPAERVVVTGSLKYDTALIAESVPGDADLAAAMGIDRERPLIVAGSTGPGEEEMVLGAFKGLREQDRGLQLAIIPRKPERFDEVARSIEANGFVCVRRSRCPSGVGPEFTRRGGWPTREGEPPREGEAPAEPGGVAVAGGKGVVLLGDTMGELRKFYSLADVVFVGRSLVPMGGSDLMEVAGLAKAMCFGPHVENFADVAEKLLAAGGAVKMQSPPDLAPTLRRLLADAAARQAMGRSAQDVVRRNTGATTRTVDLLCDSLGRREDHFGGAKRHADASCSCS
ncbi:3-deoxy-D-manno-octulosonic acid transferase [bacterium]|nr:3-deoxy-D-manno-octulosonic acid transferase [bacterium]